MSNADKNYIGGQWLAPSVGDTVAVSAAASGAVIAHVPASAVGDINDAVAFAKEAFPSWSGMPAPQRAEFLQAISDKLAARADELAQVIATEVGMPLKLSARVQVAGPLEAWRRYAQRASVAPATDKLGNSVVAREPVGVVGCITPWNYPLHQITAKVAAALAAGCTVVLKPSEVAPGAARILAEAVHAARLPAGVFNLVWGLGAIVGEALVAHPDVDMVSFTGSTQAGRRVAGTAALSVKRVTLELGGKSAAVVLDDADLALAVKASVNGCFLNSGQTCSAPTRLIVPASRFEEAAALACSVAQAMTLGDPMDATTRLGPLASAEQQQRVRDHIDKACAAGIRLLCGGTAQPEGLPVGYYVSPTVFGPVPVNAAIAQEEVFGPVLCILTHDGDEDAVRIANASAYGLAATVWSKDSERAFAVSRQIRAGQIDINGAPFNLDAPFGGFKQSGYGRENGAWGMEEFFEIKSIQVPA